MEERVRKLMERQDALMGEHQRRLDEHGDLVALFESNKAELENQHARLQSQVDDMHRSTQTRAFVRVFNFYRTMTLVSFNKVRCINPISNFKNVYFDGCNVKVNSGGVVGRGNVIVGYNKRLPTACPNGCSQSGQNNLVVGEFNDWTGTGGIVVGLGNGLVTNHASILGGEY